MKIAFNSGMRYGIGERGRMEAVELTDAVKLES
jgi:hypothetical protein